LLLREIEAQFGFIAAFARCFTDRTSLPPCELIVPCERR
jgi:hypothetical protein